MLTRTDVILFTQGRAGGLLLPSGSNIPNCTITEPLFQGQNKEGRFLIFFRFSIAKPFENSTAGVANSIFPDRPAGRLGER